MVSEKDGKSDREQNKSKKQFVDPASVWGREAEVSILM
jgi:hypothetical protein